MEENTQQEECSKAVDKMEDNARISAGPGRCATHNIEQVPENPAQILEEGTAAFSDQPGSQSAVECEENPEF